MMWRNIVILKLLHRFHTCHHQNTVLVFSQLMLTFHLFSFSPTSMTMWNIMYIKFIKYYFSIWHCCDFWVNPPASRCELLFLFATYFVIDGGHDRFQLEGLMESPSVDDDVDCFSPLLLNATSINIEAYYNKAVNYTLMVTFVSFNQ